MSDPVEKARAAVLVAARREADALREAARESLRRATEEFRARTAAALAERLAAAEAALREKNRRAVAQARREGRLRVLSARNRALDEVFARAGKEILALPAEARREVLRRRLGECARDLGGEVLPAAADRPLLAGLIAEENRSRPPAGQLRLSGSDAPFATGFVLRTATYEIRRSLEGWLMEKRRETAPDLGPEPGGNER